MSLPDCILFDSLSVEEREALYRSGVVRTFAPGATLFHEEDPAEQLFLVLEGQVRVWRASRRGASMTIHVAEPGATPGLVSVIRDAPFPANATAIGHVVACTWPAERLRSLSATHPAFLAAVLDQVTVRAQELLQRLHEVSTLPVPQRVARTLVRMVEAREAEAEPFRVAVSRQELAELSATTLHTVSRLVSRWNKARIVSAGRKCIVVTDAVALDAIAEL